jgi:hypothetical protein
MRTYVELRQVDVTQTEHQGRGLNAAALVALLCRNAGVCRHERVGRRIDDDAARVFARSSDGCERRAAHRLAVELGIEHVGVQQQRHPRFAHHLEQQRFVNFRIERRNRSDVIGGIVQMTRRGAFAYEALDDLLRDAAHDSPIAGVKGHPRTHHRGGRRSTQEAVSLDQQRTRPAACRRQRGRAAGVAAAHHQYVEFHRGRPSPQAVGAFL